MKTNQPEEYEEVVQLGEDLMKHCDTSNIPALKLLIDNLGDKQILTFHIVKAFKQALAKHNPHVLGFFLQNDLDLGHPVFKGTMPALIARKDLDIEITRSLVDLLLIGGMSINDTESESGSTGLHIACAM